MENGEWRTSNPPARRQFTLAIRWSVKGRGWIRRGGNDNPKNEDQQKKLKGRRTANSALSIHCRATICCRVVSPTTHCLHSCIAYSRDFADLDIIFVLRSPPPPTERLHLSRVLSLSAPPSLSLKPSEVTCICFLRQNDEIQRFCCRKYSCCSRGQQQQQ